MQERLRDYVDKELPKLRLAERRHATVDHVVENAMVILHQRSLATEMLTCQSGYRDAYLSIGLPRCLLVNRAIEMLTCQSGYQDAYLSIGLSRCLLVNRAIEMLTYQQASQVLLLFRLVQSHNNSHLFASTKATLLLQIVSYSDG